MASRDVRMLGRLSGSLVSQMNDSSGKQLASHRILVVDDNRDSAKTLAMLLGITGHDTLVAHDGLAAI